jgi:hypothetical protein
LNMSNYEYLTLNRIHEEQIRNFYDSLPTAGGIHFSLNRSPDFFGALEVEGDDSEVFVMRKQDSSEIITSIIVSKKQCYINSKETSIFYISSLRLAEKYRNRLLGFFAKAFYIHQHEKGRILSLMTIFEDNTIAKKNLLTGKGYLPLMKDLGLIHTFIFKPLSAGKSKLPNADLFIRSAGVTDIAAITCFLNEHGKNKNFFPVYKENLFNSEKGLLRQLRMEDIALAFDKDQLCGVMGLWDQTGFRHWKIHTYTTRLNLLKPFINFYSLLSKKPMFPSSGKPVDYRNFAIVCINNNDQSVFNNLLDFHMKLLNGRKNLYLAYAMHESNPFLQTFPLPCIDLTSRLYLTYWREDEALVSSIMPGEVYIETGAL